MLKVRRTPTGKPLSRNENSGNSCQNLLHNTQRVSSFTGMRRVKHHTFDSNTVWVLSYDLHALQGCGRNKPGMGNVPDRIVIKWRPNGSHQTKFLILRVSKLATFSHAIL